MEFLQRTSNGNVCHQGNHLHKEDILGFFFFDNSKYFKIYFVMVITHSLKIIKIPRAYANLIETPSLLAIDWDSRFSQVSFEANFSAVK